MSKIIQQVPISPEISLYLYEFKDGILSFKTNKSVKRLTKEKVVIENDIVYTEKYHFHSIFLTYISEEPVDNKNES